MVIDRTQIGQQGHELVAPEASHGVALAQALGHVDREPYQQPITRVVTMAIIDVLEAVQIDVRQRQTLAVAPHALHRLSQPIGQQHAIGQTGQRIIMGDLLEPTLVLLLHADVGEQTDEMTDLASPVDHRADGEHFDEHLAILASIPDLSVPVPL